jgi:hypothetical protein
MGVEYEPSGTVYFNREKCKVLMKYECGNITVFNLETPKGERIHCVKEFLTKPVMYAVET